MADFASQLRNFIYQIADSRRKSHPAYFHKSSKRLNRAEIARELNLSEARLSRLIRGKNKPRNDFWIHLLSWSRLVSMADLYDQIERAPEAPPAAWWRK